MPDSSKPAFLPREYLEFMQLAKRVLEEPAAVLTFN